MTPPLHSCQMLSMDPSPNGVYHFRSHFAEMIWETIHLSRGCDRIHLFIYSLQGYFHCPLIIHKLDSAWCSFIYLLWRPGRPSFSILSFPHCSGSRHGAYLFIYPPAALLAHIYPFIPISKMIGILNCSFNSDRNIKNPHQLKELLVHLLEILYRQPISIHLFIHLLYCLVPAGYLFIHCPGCLPGTYS